MNTLNLTDIFGLKTNLGYIAYYKNDLAFINSLMSGRIYEQDYVLKNLIEYISKSKTILDIGAHAGSHTVIYKAINKNATVHSFEPQSKMFDLLNFNIEKNNFENVFTHNVAVANISKTTTLSDKIFDQNSETIVSYGNTTYSNLGGVQVGPGGENIETITIDSLDLDGCDFIKIDVEGFEPLVLLGAEETIRKYKPVILFEKNFKKVSDEVLAEFGVTPEQNNSFDLLNKFGYSNIQLIGDEINYLAVPDNA